MWMTLSWLSRKIKLMISLLTKKPDRSEHQSSLPRNLTIRNLRLKTNTLDPAIVLPHVSTPFVVLPYLEGLSQRLRWSCEGFGIKTIFKPHRTLRQQLVALKQKSDPKDLSGMVSRIPCKDYNKVYIAELVRAFADRLKEHTFHSRTTLKTSAVAEHRALTGHKTEFDNITILDRGVKNTLAQNQGVYFYPQRITTKA